MPKLVPYDPLNVHGAAAKISEVNTHSQKLMFSSHRKHVCRLKLSVDMSSTSSL